MDHFPRSPERAFDDLDSLSPGSRMARQRSHSASPPRQSHAAGSAGGAASGYGGASDDEDDRVERAAATIAAAGGVLPRQFGEMSGGAKRGATEAVRVVCRFRPENEQEQRIGQFCVGFEGDDKVTLNRPDRPGSGAESTFDFNRVFQPFSSQQQLFDHIGAPIVDAIMSGINGAVIAYGQTGTGKTYTMIGLGI